ncbi:MAG: hypothetical protein KAI29_07565 [Cyclobacteriaceae bacterium]|nr:hypothetical protein [Cyclobacteriaceae bacterium]MCK5700992.1 hypothetical protein [Cyclobacteriaceae bacterium]
MIVKFSRRIVLIVVLVIIGNSPSVFSAQIDFCKLFGSVYIEKNPKLAGFRVYEEDSEAFCDVKIFEVESRVYADREGLWHFTDTKAFADFTIYFEPKKGLADFSVYFIDIESFAGCNN